ncbi:iron ABC transporter substrate-binding protein [Micrococcus sp. HMSC067E09]|uniref:siderophore ABC transporter substrate-binding protein n=1 Tax=Micrococcus sp. HMSC067E09 TaxID=1739367 RepID=UPI0008A4C96D|nr:ABC transporter substrate-binding protein [Micrococcus sp. HMSC067E09]OFR87719.1 iron ABC transporter substrate-binding protein [Micrococcus sp. HMSC067E09]
MAFFRQRATGALALSAAALLALSACAGGDSASTSSGSSASASQAEQGTPAATVTDMAGDEVTLPEDPKSVIATDNRSFRTLDDWGIELSAAPRALMNGTGVSYEENDDVYDLGSHREPDMEGFVTAEPDLIINGQRFSSMKEDIKGLAPEAALVDTNIDTEAEDFRMDEALKQHTTLLGEVFGHQDDAKKLIEDFDASIERAKDAYDKDQTVMGLIASGGNLAYAAPSTGRAVGPVFDILGLTPSLEQDGSTNHMGDDISVEAIAQSNPDWIIVMDRDAATSASKEADYSTAEELIKQSPVLKDVTAVKEDQIIYLPNNFYLTEDIQNYTTLMNEIADAFGSKA